MSSCNVLCILKKCLSFEVSHKKSRAYILAQANMLAFMLINVTIHYLSSKLSGAFLLIVEFVCPNDHIRNSRMSLQHGVSCGDCRPSAQHKEMCSNRANKKIADLFDTAAYQSFTVIVLSDLIDLVFQLNNKG